VRVVYTSSSVALAVLEVLAYRKARRPLTPRLLYSVQLMEAQLRRLAPRDLTDDWRSYPYPTSTQALGNAWVAAGETLALAVPSVLAPPEVNVMLNCAHADFSMLDIEGPAVFPISPRLTPDVAEETIGGGDAGV
jgi:RES domain-containing protein